MNNVNLGNFYLSNQCNSRNQLQKISLPGVLSSVAVAKEEALAKSGVNQCPSVANFSSCFCAFCGYFSFDFPPRYDIIPILHSAECKEFRPLGTAFAQQGKVSGPVGPSQIIISKY